jgi:hypothetical protein
MKRTLIAEGFHGYAIKSYCDFQIEREKIALGLVLDYSMINMIL